MEGKGKGEKSRERGREEGKGRSRKKGERQKLPLQREMERNSGCKQEDLPTSAEGEERSGWGLRLKGTGQTITHWRNTHGEGELGMIQWQMHRQQNAVTVTLEIKSVS